MNTNKRCKNNFQRKQQEKNCVNKKVVKITKTRIKLKTCTKNSKFREEKRKEKTQQTFTIFLIKVKQNPC